ncbi:MAG TPA: glycoside hydrolase family 95 protein, partial [Thermoanaerobaculia bacterium]|nr:glycoside hydrolase family 95 protein [Thermoanaerobaculia bacterium]
MTRLRRAAPAVLRFALVLCLLAASRRAGADDSATRLWYAHPADRWQNALPIGNGRLGALVFGKTDEERIPLNEDTYWTGGPYSTTVAGASRGLTEVRRLIFDGELVRAHRAFGRSLMGYPVEQQKYQSLGALVLTFAPAGPVRSGTYRHELDLDTAIATTTYEAGGVVYRREAFVSPVDQVVVLRLTASAPGRVSFTAQLRGDRNQAHSNYATDYFRMDGEKENGLAVHGKSADYLGVAGRLRYASKMRAIPRGGEMRIVDDALVVRGADEALLLIAAATNFVSYRDVSGDPDERVDGALRAAVAKSFDALRDAHVAEHRRLFRTASLRLGNTAASRLPTDERRKAFDGTSDADLAALIFQFGRYLLISSSRPGTEPANLQGIWNPDANPMWDSKYTTNINLEMNYWPAEVANLSEMTEPLFRLIREASDQGAAVAREHYGA